MNKTKLITILWIVCAVLAIISIAFMVAYFVSIADKKEYKKQLEFVYDKSFYELSDNVNNIEMNLSKLNASNSNSYQAKVVDNLIEQTNMAQNNLATLPLNDNSITKTISFVNSTNGFCTSLSRQLALGKPLNDDQKYSVEVLRDSAKNVKDEINRFAMLLSNDYRIVDNMQFNNNDLDTNFSGQFATLEEPSVEYPKLIYDGPFSDSVMNKEIKCLGDEEITKIQAQQKIDSQVFNYTTMEYVGMTEGKFVTYNFNLNFEDNSVGFLQITKNGGMILSYNRSHDLKKAKYSQEECVQNALKFVSDLGFLNMKSVWYADAEGYLYVNLAYQLDDITFYPDLIKVKVAMDSGEIVGMEAMSYAYNHCNRINVKPKIDATIAKEIIQPELYIQKTTLCVVPNEYVGESLAWEFQATSNGNQFYAYVDAQTGQLLEIMKVVETNDGNLLM